MAQLNSAIDDFTAEGEKRLSNEISKLDRDMEVRGLHGVL
jgi:hypothetical protein